MRSVLRILLPGGVVVALALGIAWFFEDAARLDRVTGQYALVLYGASAILAGAFHRSRVVAAVVALAGVDFFRALPPAEAADPFVPMATLLVGLLGVLAVFRDRGVTSRGGLAQLFGGGLVTLVAYVGFSEPERLASFWDVEVLAVGLSDAVGLPQGTLVVGGAGLVLGLYGVHRWRGPVEGALLWSQLIVLAALLLPVSAAGTSFLMMAAGLALVISVLQTSYLMAYRDELTGLPARRALMHDLDAIGGTYALAMVDVDHFKRFNDKHGHDVGDQVLQLVAKHLAAGPGGGKAYRYGGEEFTLVYPGREKDDALPHADAAREAVEDASFTLRSWNRPRKKPEGRKSKKKGRRRKKLSVTISVGLADSTGKKSEAADVLKRADQALYRAKRDGRNRVAT